MRDVLLICGCVWALLSVQPVCAAQTPCTAAVAIDRDVYGYECGATKVGGFVSPASTIALAQSEVRAFVWEHYQSKKRAFVSLILQTREGDHTDLTFYIEPGGEGRWVVVVAEEQYQRNRRKGGFLPKRHSEQTAVSVQRVDSPSSNKEPATIGKGPKAYYLELLDTQGAVLQRL